MKILLIIVLVILGLSGCNNLNTNIGTINNSSITEIGDKSQLDLFKPLSKHNVITKKPTPTPTTTPTPAIVTPVPGESYIDGMYESSDIKIDNNSINLESFEFDLSNILHEEIKALIVNIYKENEYTEYEFVRVTEEEDWYYYGFEEVKYVVKFNNNEYWVLTYSDGKAYSVKDEYGIFSNTD